MSMGIDASNNIKLKQQEKDSPFLTLSERNQKGISSQNIFGGDEKAGQTQEPKRTERIAQLNIFGAEEGGQVKDDTSVFGEQEQKGCDEYFQENAKGEMNFDTNGFYGDAIGVSFGSSASSNPIKAGASDTKGLETELKLMLRNPEQNKTQIENLKEQIKAQGGDADKIIADNTPKTGATKGANATTKAGTTENAAKTATAGTTATASKTATGNAANALGSGGSVSDLMAYADQAGIGTQVDIEANRGATNDLAGVSAQVSEKEPGVVDAIKEEFSIPKVTSKVAEAAIGAGANGVMDPVKETISSYMKDGLKAIGLGKGSDKGGDLDAGKAKNAKDVKEAEGHVNKGQNAGSTAKGEQKEAVAGKNKAAGDVKKGEATRAGASNNKLTAEQQKVSNQETEALEKENADIAKMSKDQKAKEVKVCDANIQKLDKDISNLGNQIDDITINANDDPATKAQKNSKKAQLQAEKAQKLIEKAKQEQRKAMAEIDEQKQAQAELAARQTAEKANLAAEQAQASADEAQGIINNADKEIASSHAIMENCDIAKASADQTIGKASAYTKEAQTRLKDLQGSAGKVAEGAGTASSTPTPSNAPAPSTGGEAKKSKR